MSKINYIAGGILLVVFMALAGCDDEPEKQNTYSQTRNQQMLDEQYVNQQSPQVVQGQAPVIVQSGDNDSGVGDFATGMILGHMVSGAMNNNRGYTDSGRTTIINNTTRQPRNSYSSTQVYQNKSRTVTSQKPSRPMIKSNSSYSAKKSYSSPMSKPSRSYSSSKSFSSSRSSYSSSRRR